MPIDIKSEIYNGYQCIHMLNGLSLSENASLYKYMPYNRLISCVEQNEMVFVSPHAWIDPFERRFWETDYSKRYTGFVRPEIACMCLTTKSTTNEEAAWKMYADDTDKALRISISVKKILNELDSFASNNDCKIYIGKAIYDFDRKNIVGLHNQINVFFPKDNNTFSIAHYLSLMCIKRKSFAFENEIRIFIVKDKLQWSGDLFKVPMMINKELIPRIIIGPLKPFASNDPRKKLYNVIQNTEKEVYKSKLLEKINNCDIRQSQLYTDKRPLLKA